MTHVFTAPQGDPGLKPGLSIHQAVPDTHVVKAVPILSTVQWAPDNSLPCMCACPNLGLEIQQEHQSPLIGS